METLGNIEAKPQDISQEALTQVGITGGLIWNINPKLARKWLIDNKMNV